MQEWTDEELAAWQLISGDQMPIGTNETVHIVHPNGDVLETITGPHRMPFPYNQAISRAGKLAFEHGGTLFLLNSDMIREGVVESSDPNGAVFMHTPAQYWPS